MFGRKRYTMTLNRVHDEIVIKEGESKLRLVVDGDATHIVAGLQRAQTMLKSLNDESKPEDLDAAARAFAVAVFGEKQADKVLEFYSGDPACIINISGRYFRDRLGKKIAKVQKRQA